MNIWGTFTDRLTSAAHNLAADVGVETNDARNAAADLVAQAGAGASITAAAAVGAHDNVYTKIQQVGADWRSWLALFVAVLIVFYAILRSQRKGK